MTLDLTAVCDRHGLHVEYDEDMGHWIGSVGVLEGDESAFIRGAESERQTVCELLKERYGITTRHMRVKDGGVAWWADDATGSTQEYSAVSQIAAVVALADRLRADPEASRG